MAIIKCGTHGKQDETFVCAHIVETIADGTPRGFHWNVSEGIFEAICSVCNDLSEDAFAAGAAENINTLCYGCFRDAAEINGVVIA